MYEKTVRTPVDSKADEEGAKHDNDCSIAETEARRREKEEKATDGSIKADAFAKGEEE